MSALLHQLVLLPPTGKDEEGNDIWELPKGTHKFSPTKITTFLECPRKWAWKYVAKIESPSGAGAELGTRVHAVLEAYLRDGKMPDHVADPQAAKIASSGLHLLPAPKTPGMLLEKEFHFLSPRTGFVYHGLKDFQLPPGAGLKALELAGDAPIVGDHKTTKSISEYAKTREDLLFDAQSGLYGADLIARFQSKSVDLAWVYYQTQGANRAHPTTVRLESEHAARVFDAVEGVATEMATALQAKREPLALAPNPTACNAYGGCPHRHRCNLKPSDQARSRMSTSLIANLRNRVQCNATTAPAGQGATATVITPPDVNITLGPSPEYDAIKAEAEALLPKEESVMGCSDKDVPAPTEVPAALMQPFKGINPPEANLTPAVQAPPVQASADIEKKEAIADKPKVKRTRKTEAKDPTGADAHAATSAVESTSSKTEATSVVESAGAPHVATSGTVEARSRVDLTKEELEATIRELTREGFTLYVDCMPIGAPAKLVSSFFAKANADIEEVHKVPDYRLVDYGRGSPLFAASVLEQVLAYGGDVIVDTRTPEGAIVLESLAAKASLVVRGLR